MQKLLLLMESDQSKAEAFAGRMMALLNDASLGMLVSIGQ
jgi:hypothetical protein